MGVDGEGRTVWETVRDLRDGEVMPLLEAATVDMSEVDADGLSEELAELTAWRGSLGVEHLGYVCAWPADGDTAAWAALMERHTVRGDHSGPCGARHCAHVDAGPAMEWPARPRHAVGVAAGWLATVCALLDAGMPAEAAGAAAMRVAGATL